MQDISFDIALIDKADGDALDIVESKSVVLPGKSCGSEK